MRNSRNMQCGMYPESIDVKGSGMVNTDDSGENIIHNKVIMVA